ncbi:unnamed protein product [Discula destructiva]
MPRKSSAIAIVDPGTREVIADPADLPTLPSGPNSSSAPRAHNGMPRPSHYVPNKLHKSHRRVADATNTNRTSSQSVNAALNGNHGSEKLERARRDARQAAVSFRLNPNRDNTTASDNDPEEVQESFNVFARPFIPKALAIINTRPGRAVDTAPHKAFQYDAYAAASFGPASGFLPHPPHPNLNTAAAPRPALVSVALRHYEAFFQLHLQQEAGAQRLENEACSLYGHEVNLRRPSEFQGQMICTLQVPGLRENSPLVEEDDVVQLRQLVYEDGTTVLRGMADWLRRKDNFEKNRPQSHSWPEEAPGWTQFIYRARVLGVVRATETLHLRVWGLPLGPKPMDKFNIQFEVPVERSLPMSFAVADAHHTLSHGGWMNSMLFPANSDSEIQERLHTGVWTQRFFDKDLNWEQKKAVESALLRSHGTLPYLISGPPGTGKTKTIIETALQMVRSLTTLNHILLCAPSDPAADTLGLRLNSHLSPAEMLRLNRPCRSFAEVPDTLLPYCCVQGDAFGLPPLETLMKFRVIVTTCRDSAMLVRARLTNTDICAVKRSMRGLSASLAPYERLPEVKLHWAGLLLDEAAQAMESEALIPLTIVAPPIENDHNSSAPVVVMAGDEYQLGPRTVLPASGLKNSLFARLFKRSVYANHPLARGKKGEAPPPLTKALLPVLRPAFANLIRNYRSHPAILAVPSNLFYWDTLEPEAKDTGRLAGWKGWQGRRWPVLFHDNKSLDDLELPGVMQGAGGWYNNGEAIVACSYAQSLVQSGLVAQNEVCIMSPFRSQVRVLRETMRQQDYGAMWDVNVGPTEAFQGLEKGVVILCVTRARKRFVKQDQDLGWGIIGMPNKMNVALTRAKYGLIVVGDRDLLMDDPNWKAFVQFCERNGLVAKSDATKRENGDGDGDGDGDGEGGASVCEETLTRQEKILLDKESARQNSEAPVLGPLSKNQAGGEMSMPGPDDYNNGDYYRGYRRNGY